MGNRYSLDDIVDLKNRNIFFDANILIYMFWTTPIHKWEEEYASLSNQLFRGYNILIDSNVVSEVVNRLIRIEHKKYEDKHGKLSFKSYRNSKEGRGELEDIYTLLKETVLPFFEISTNKYTIEVIDSFLKVDNLDFGDKTIEYACKENGYVLLTNDSDFKNSEVDILTSNPLFF